MQGIEERVEATLHAVAEQLKPASGIDRLVTRRLHRRAIRRRFAVACLTALGVGAIVALPLALRHSTDDKASVVAGPSGSAQARENTFSLPRPGRTAARFLVDGTPVFIRHGADGSIGVVSAVDAHRPFGVGDVVWWCPSSQQFEEPQSGTIYDETGTAVGGPAPQGLVTYRWERVGPGASKIRVTTADAPAPRDPLASPSTAGSTCFALTGNEPRRTVVRHKYPIPNAKVYSPSEAVDARPRGLEQIQGVVDMDRDRVRVCKRLVGSRCSGFAPVRDAVPVDNHQIADGLFLARVSDGQLSTIVLVRVAYRGNDADMARCFRGVGLLSELSCSDYEAMFVASGTTPQPGKCYIISGFFPQETSCVSGSEDKEP